MDKMCILQHNNIICVHAKMEEKDEMQKDDFHEDLERIYMKVPKHDTKVMMGDFNAKVGKESGLAPNVGKYSLHEETNNDGWRMIDFAITKNMAICSRYSNIKEFTKKHGDHQMELYHIRLIM